MQQPIPKCSSQPLNIHGLPLKDKQDENWGQLFAPMMSQWNNRAEFRVDVYPRQEGLLSFNSDYMGEVAETLQYMVSPQGRNTWTVDDLVPYMEKITILSKEQEKITKPYQSVDFHHKSFTCFNQVLKFEVLADEGRLLKRKNFPNKWRSVAMKCITCHQHFLSILHRCISHDTDMSASEHSYGGVAESHPHFSWPTMTPSQQHDAPMATPNTPLAPQWNVPEAIPDMGDLLGVDLRHEFSVEAEQVEAGRHRGRRNPDRQARRWDRPCSTSSRHHGHHNE
ncbi:hypothetical protein GmHk_05G012580 [Glycine max]|nr:hypothetical protein GmHk_05G012580 [Glycine max]